MYDYDYYSYYNTYQPSPFTSFLGFAVSVFTIICLWKIFEKAGKPGWASLVPFYNLYVLFEITYGNGWKFLFLLIPIANIVFAIIVYVKLAKAFGKEGGFAVGLIFLFPVFAGLLAFDEKNKYVGVPK